MQGNQLAFTLIAKEPIYEKNYFRDINLSCSFKPKWLFFLE